MSGHGQEAEENDRGQVVPDNRAKARGRRSRRARKRDDDAARRRDDGDAGGRSQEAAPHDAPHEQRAPHAMKQTRGANYDASFDAE